eukprot:m.9806 g.9806  ORF g.9806 m.9806 type:complete len:408 (+) comp6428_c0_seq1:70-1293(+)
MGKGRGDFTEEPEEGWLHDETALAMGEGVFYSYPLQLLGHVEIKQSLSKLERKFRTAAVEEMMMRLLEDAERIKKKKRKVKKEVEPFANGAVTLAQLPVSLGIAADGMVIIPNLPNMDTMGPDAKILFYHTMFMISMAAGGSSKQTYTLVAYVAKDETGARACYVFDCEDEETSDEVLATLGQSFLLAQDLQAKRKARPKKEEVKEYLDTVPEYDVGQGEVAEEPVYDMGQTPVVEDPVYDVGNTGKEPEPKEEPLYDTGDQPMEIPEYSTTQKPIEAEPEYDVGNQQAEEEPLYDVATEMIEKLNKKDNMRRSVRQSARMSTKKGRKSMKKRQSMKKKSMKQKMKTDKVDLNEVGMTDAARPSWVCISEVGAAENKVDLNSLLRDFKLGAVEEVIEEEEEEDDQFY